MTEVSYQVEQWPDAKGEIIPLAEKHFYECNVADGRHPFSLAEQNMDSLHDLSMIHVTTARHNGALAGYIVNLLSRHLLYDGLCSNHIGWYVAKEFRNSKTGIGLLRASEGFLKDAGVERMIGMHTDQLDASAAFSRLGWCHVEHHYSKWVN